MHPSSAAVPRISKDERLWLRRLMLQGRLTIASPSPSLAPDKERMAAMRTHEQQAFIGSILPSGVPRNWAPLAGVIRVHPDQHTICQPGFVCCFGLNIRETPTVDSAVGVASP